MLSKVLLFVSLFAAVAVAAPALFIRDQPKRNVPCTSIVSPGGTNPAPSPSVILLNGPSQTQPSPYDVGRIAGSQVPGSPPVINLNPTAASPPVINHNPSVASPSIINLNGPGASPSVIKLNRRQFGSLPPTSTFSFGGITPSSTISFTSLAPPGAPTAGSISGASNGTSIFSSTGPDGVKTILLLSTTTVTVSGNACSSASAFNPSSVIAPASAPPVSVPSSNFNPTSSAFGANIQASSPALVSSPSIINLNSPHATITSAPGFSFTSAPVPSVTPTV